MKAILAHIREHRELYLYLPASMAITYGAILFAFFLSGRPVIESPGIMVSYAMQFFGLTLCGLFAGLSQTHLFGYRSTRTDSPRLVDDLYDACITLALLFFSAHYLFPLLTGN